MNKKSISTLTSLRFFAAFFVFSDHYLTRLFFIDPDKWGAPLSYIAITFFFTLSGFVLTYAYQEAFEQNKISKRKFYLGRIARIWPLHILCLILTVPFAIEAFHIHFSQSILYLIANILLLQDFIPHSADLFNGVSWSISAEMFFYLCFPYLLILALKKKKLFNSLHALFFLCLIIAITYITPSLLDSKFTLLNFIHVSWPGIFYVFPFIRIFDFGCVIFLYFCYKRFLKTNYRKRTYDYLEISAILFLILSYGLFQTALPILLKVDILYLPTTLFMILIFSVEKGTISRILTKPSFILLGEASFAFYMLQYPIGKFLECYLKTSLVLLTCFQLIILVLVSILLHKYFEMPCYIKIRKYFGVKRQINLHNYLT